MRIVQFLVFIAVAWSIMFVVHMVVYNAVSRVFDVTFSYWPLWLALLSFTYFLASIGVRQVQHAAADVFYYIAATWLGVVFLMFSAALIYEAIHLVTGDSKLLLGLMLGMAVLLSIYALFNGRIITTRELTIPIQGIEETLRVVHLSDIHVGTVHQKKYLQDVVAKTNALNPDLVLVTGDLFDGSAPIEEEILLPLNELNAPSYFSNGNHEEYEGLVKVRDTIANLDMQLLDNQVVTTGGLQIIGVNDRQSIPKSQTLGSILDGLELEKDVPTLLMYHSPTEWDDAKQRGIALMLSGHTHNGQVYPFNLLVRMAFKYVNGLYQDGEHYLHVSPGTGTWGPPMRLGSRNQITLLSLNPVQ